MDIETKEQLDAYILAKNARLAEAARQQSLPHPAAHLVQDFVDVDEQEEFTDAEIIADLLEALRMMLDAFHEDPISGNCTFAVELAYASIEKAEAARMVAE